MILKVMGCFLFLGYQLVIAQTPRLEYHLSMEEPQTHYFDVEMAVTNLPEKHLDFKMAVWTPGSYLVREFANNVQEFRAFGENGKAFQVEKISKHIWRVYSNESPMVRISYRVYAYQLSVRTSHLDESHAYINGASVFMYLDELMHSSTVLSIEPMPQWKSVSTSLKPVSEEDSWTLKVPNFDILVDSPIEIGNHKIIEFEAAGIPHFLAIHGEGNYSDSLLIEDITTIIEEATNVIGENPCTDYTFLIHNTHSGSGGLEHLNSTSLICNRWGYTGNGHIRFLGLVSHEYFHLWNVKRIRPFELGPFNYENENYTDLLWICEGFTSYYDDIILRRSGLIGVHRYLNIVANTVNFIENSPGNKIQPVAEASFDAWIKYYRPNENSANSTISYYTKGALIGTLLDLEIIHQTKGEKSLDDVMRFLYKEYYKKQKRGFTAEEFQQVAEKTSGTNLDDFFRDYVYGTVPIDYARYLGYAGLELTDDREGMSRPILGIRTVNSGGRLSIRSVSKESAAWDYGLNVHDEILGLNEFRVRNKEDLDKQIKRHLPGDTVTVLLNRDGIIKEFSVVLREDPSVSFRLSKTIEASKKQKAVFKKWLNADWD